MLHNLIFGSLLDYLGAGSSDETVVHLPKIDIECEIGFVSFVQDGIVFLRRSTVEIKVLFPFAALLENLLHLGLYLLLGQLSAKCLHLPLGF
jgi:hypothetical protein